MAALVASGSGEKRVGAGPEKSSMLSMGQLIGHLASRVVGV
jgi:hypothetical protein